MSNMRLTTLNLDKECLDVLGAAKNKSAKARECIRKYDAVSNDLDEEVRRRDQWERGMGIMAEMMVDAFGKGTSFNEYDRMLAELLDVTVIDVHKMHENNYLAAAIKTAVFRHGKL